ncbi:hypothetical protein PV325_008532 [Microctonus aethiopoides]|uniref:Phospholipid/glycerol acyltransferase domain-containing protein n=1 Tax=Microctonus aethiopoides TaxID=144406 RepID=A0AA39EZG5_9HYME|nr:hypothetical protein PV325_008532 [Microctonus aethiopoides]KAK0159959.1 hypothetical protein PV328_007414 [Microctonus aethiopoides]
MADNISSTMTYFDLIHDRRKSSDLLWATRYMVPLAPHTLSREENWSRNEAIEAVLIHPKVIPIIDELAATRNVDKLILIREARLMLEEMASKQHLPTFRWLALILVKVLKRILQSFRVNVKYVLEIKSQMEHSDVQYVYVPSHRSYLDFILMSYLLFNYDMAIPNIASGMDFYRMHVVGELLRKTGAFYMRRSFSSDKLYKEIFKAYVAALVEHSDRAIEFFIEGTRSRSQKSISPKYGLLAMILESLFHAKVSDIHFIPVSISYDRPLEESLFSYELLGVPKPAESTTGLFRSLSILREQSAHGHVYFHVSPPISALKFMDPSARKLSALSPLTKIPTDIVKNIAYAIIDSHNKYTIFMPINLIAVLFNERIHSHPGNPYTFETLLQDYIWFRKFITQTMGASVCPKVENIEEEPFKQSEKDEIKECLHTHRNLLNFDSNNLLILQAAHREIKSNKTIRVKGHTLDERTMRITVPAINIGIYVNPLFAIFTKPSIAVMSIHRDGLTEEKAADQFTLLRKLLATEFALADNVDKQTILNEWNHELTFLINEKCVALNNNEIYFSSNNNLRKILRNILVPYIGAIYVTCLVLHQWDNTTMGESIEQEILKECQKRTEILLFQDDSLINHPYTLSLDLYQSTLVSLTNYEAITLLLSPSSSSDNKRIYQVNKNILSSLIDNLEMIISQQRSLGCYLDIASSFNHQNDNTLQAKL